jgi:hypothetical protein
MGSKKPVFDVSVKYPSKEFENDWRTIGRAFQEPDGKIIVKLGGMPFAGWDGSFVLFPKPCHMGPKLRRQEM